MTFFCPSTSTFFGLTPSYKNVVHQQIHDLVFHGGGGFKHSEVYNMPIWMRKFHILAINEHNKKENEKLEKLQKQQDGSSTPVMGPNVNPPSTYNFKK